LGLSHGKGVWKRLQGQMIDDFDGWTNPMSGSLEQNLDNAIEQV